MPSLQGGLIGAATGGPLGASVGAFGGDIMNALNPQQGGISKGEIDQITQDRLNEISDLRGTLANARQQFLQQLPQFQSYAMGRFMPQIEAQYAGRGLQVSGGAFGSALGRAAGDFQAQQMLAAPQMAAQDAMTVDNAYSNLWGSRLGGAYQNMQPPNPFPAALGQFVGQAGMMALGNQFNQSRDNNLINAMSQARMNGGNVVSGQVVPNYVMQNPPQGYGY